MPPSSASHTRYSDVFFLCCCQPVKSRKHHRVVFHSVPHACNPSPKSTYCKWSICPTTLQWRYKAATEHDKILCLAKTAWLKRIQAFEDLLGIPEHNGRLFKSRQTPASFAGVFCLLWNTSVSLQSSLVQGVLSASIRSCVKLSDHLPLALKHEGERFSDHSEKQLTEAPSLLL